MAQGLFAKTYGWAGSNEYGYCVVQTPDGGFAVAGITNSSFGAGGEDVLVLRLNPDGSLLWAKAYGGTGADGAYSIVHTADNGFAVAGYTESFGALSRDILVLKLDSDGGLTWAKHYIKTGRQEAHCIVQTTDGGYAVAASGDDLVVLKLKADGDTNWARYYYGPSWGGDAFSLVQTTDDGYAVTGTAIVPGLQDDNATPVLRLDSDGSVLWSKFFLGMVNGTGVIFDQGNSIIQTSDGGFAIAGVTDVNLADLPTLMAVKLGWDGGLSWATATGGPWDQGNSIIQTPDGGFVVAGPAQSLGRVFLIMKLAPGGVLAWSRTLDVYNFDTPHSLIQTTDGGFLVTGDVYNTNDGNRDAAILKLGGDGNYSGCVVDQAPTMVTPEFDTLNLGISAPTWAHSSASPPVATTSLLPTVINVCTPLYEGTIEDNSCGHPLAIFCAPSPGALLFVADMETTIEIYSPDGRLAYSGNLVKGENRITLDPPCL